MHHLLLKLLIFVTGAFVLAACSPGDAESQKYSFDTLIINGTVFTGTLGDEGNALAVGVTAGKVTFLGNLDDIDYEAKQTVDATGLVVAPGFIDPHTHALGDLLSEDRSLNENYLTQGVTTVFTGNDGGGPANTGETLMKLSANKPGSNIALFVGHGEVRRAVLGDADRLASEAELEEMSAIVRKAMVDGALGLSAGLYYVPGSFANTEELIALAEETAPFGGVYDSHLRDESSYNIGLVAAVEEALEIGRKGGVAVHIAHIKALGTDVWGKSAELIQRIEAAQREGLQVTADQYPWRASGTRISSALIPTWARDGGNEALFERFRDPALKARIDADIAEAIRIRGGPEALLITGGVPDEIIGKTFGEVARERGLDYVEAAKTIVVEGDARVASFNMQKDDIEAFMQQPWVMTSSDGTNGHPRKFASFPRKYTQYVQARDEGAGLISLSDFIHRSTGLTADTFSLCGRGYLREGYVADIVVFNPETYRDVADFLNPRAISEGVEYLFVNGVAAIAAGDITGERGGNTLRRGVCH